MRSFAHSQHTCEASTLIRYRNEGGIPLISREIMFWKELLPCSMQAYYDYVFRFTGSVVHRKGYGIYMQNY